MPTNGHKPSVLQNVIGLLQDQLDLFSLEMSFEKHQLRKRLLAFIMIGVFAVMAFTLFQVALILWLSKVGSGVAGICALIGALYGFIAFSVFWSLGRRDSRAGRPFAGSRRQLDENLKWIQTLFS